MPKLLSPVIRPSSVPRRPRRSRRFERGANWIVIVIVLAVLAAAGFYAYPRYIAPRFGGAAAGTATAEGAACSGYATQIRAALKQYKDDTGRNPPTLGALDRYGISKDVLQTPSCSFHYNPLTGDLYDMSPGEGSAPAPAAATGGSGSEP